jgi:6-phosphogluconolactonase
MKTILLLLIMFGISAVLQGQVSTKKVFNLLIGTYSKPGAIETIFVYSFNAETGELVKKSSIGDIVSPSFLTISNDRKFVYAVSEAGDGTVHAFSFNAITGQLVFLNKASAGGDGPCHLSVDEKNKFVFVGNYGGGSLSAIPINPDGSLSQDIQTIIHEGKSIKPNQDKPHVHATVLSPDGKYLMVPDLGTDKINIYQIDYSKNKPLSPGLPAFATVSTGGGPRHFTFHPNGKWAYVIHENTGDITGFEYENGKLKGKETIALAPKGFSGNIHAADIHVSPDGMFLYGSMRGDLNEIGIMAIDKKGKLQFIGRQSTEGKIPRNFAIDPTNNFLLVGNQNSDEIILFKRNKKTGMLSNTGKKISVGKPVCLIFSEVE